MVRIVLLALIIGVSLILPSSLNSTASSAYAATSHIDIDIDKGTLDLSSATTEAGAQKVSIEGEWRFYRDQLLTQDSVASTGTLPEYVQVPEFLYKPMDDGKATPFTGYGSIHLKLILPAEDIGQSKALYVRDIASAYSVWVNGEKLGGIGTVGTSAAEEIPQSRLKLLYFKPDHTEVDIMIQASNFTSRQEGAFEKIIFGDAEALTATFAMEMFYYGLMIGGLLVLGLYHLILFVMMKRDRSTLYIGLLGVDIGIRAWNKNTYLVDLIAPFMNWEAIVKLDYLTGFIGYLFLVLMMKHMYPQEMNRVAARISHIAVISISLFVWMTPSRIYTQTLTSFMVLLVGISLFTVCRTCILALVRKREGAIINMVGYIIVLVCSINDVFMYQRMLETVELLYAAIFTFILLQAIIVSYRYSLLLGRNITLSGDLLQFNRSLEQKVEERTADLNRKNEDLADMHRSKTEMLANISHDMGSPLTGIQMNLQLIRDGLLNPEQQHTVAVLLLDKATYIKRLNDDLFELSKLESGQFKFRLERVCLKGFMNELADKLGVDVANEGMQLRRGTFVTSVGDQEAWIRVDAISIKRVLDNYIQNAVKFSKNLSTTIQLSCSIVTNDEGIQDGGQQEIDAPSKYQVRVAVTDYGSGIMKHEILHVFDRFYRRAEGNANGTGLGLTIVKEIIENHHGEVGVISNSGEGSTFYFTLPIHFEE